MVVVAVVGGINFFKAQRASFILHLRCRVGDLKVQRRDFEVQKSRESGDGRIPSPAAARPPLPPTPPENPQPAR